MNIPNFHGRLYTVLIAFVCQLYCTANVLNKIPPFWLTSFALRGPGSFTHSLGSWGGCSMRGEARLLVSIWKHGSMHYAKRNKLCSPQKYTGVVLSYVFRKDSREVPVYRGATMACFRIIEERRQTAQTSHPREMATLSADRTAQTPPILLVTWRMCNILARMTEDTFYKMHIQLLELNFCNALALYNNVHYNYMYSEATCI